MKAVQLDDVGQSLVVREVPLPVPDRGEVLVKMAASPINPSDLAFISGGYGFKTGFPVIPGNEGSGAVVASGGGFMGRRLVGKRVACFARIGIGGAWAEYMVTNASHCVPVRKDTGSEQAAMALVNPLTALAFINIVKRGRHAAFLNTAAASALGRMLVRLGKRIGIPLINVVRRENQADELRKLGAEYVLVSSEEGFEERLKALSHELGATLFLDAVGGSLLGQLVLAAPMHTTILAYGRLSAEPCIIEPGALVLQHKSIVGFFLSEWVKTRNLMQLLGDLRKVKKMLDSDMKTDIKHRMSLNQADEAISTYKTEMTGGKILLMPEIFP